MRLPDFLIIGAMKSGTSGLFLDLCLHPNIFLPDDKEPGALASDSVLEPAGREKYAQLYRTARADQLVCDASTTYTKLPDVTDVATWAAKVLGDDFRVIYIVRDPVDRIISHHHHEVIEGKVDADIDRVVREDPRFVNYSRYAYQLQPWIDAIGLDRVKIVRFETYKKNRQETIAELCEFLGLPVDRLPSVGTAVHNSSATKSGKSVFWDLVRNSMLYRYLLRPFFSLRARAAFAKVDRASRPWPARSSLYGDSRLAARTARRRRGPIEPACKQRDAAVGRLLGLPSWMAGPRLLLQEIRLATSLFGTLQQFAATA